MITRLCTNTVKKQDKTKWAGPENRIGHNLCPIKKFPGKIHFK